MEKATLRCEEERFEDLFAILRVSDFENRRREPQGSKKVSHSGFQ